MKTCKDCIHFDVCNKQKITNHRISQSVCKHFKDKSIVLDLPCKVGQTCYKVLDKEILEVKVVSIHYEPLPAFSYTIRFNRLGVLCLLSDGSRNEKYSDDIYLTRKEAEQALKEREQR